MKRELGIARCGLACCLCGQNETCNGCQSNKCPDKEWCMNRKCTIEKGFGHCFECPENCGKFMLEKVKPKAFSEFARRYGTEHLLNCLERNEQSGIVYHRDGIKGDYDDFDNVEKLIEFIENGNHI